ncbi:peptidase [Alloprevotella tannerae]|uniref:peptidase n=1 Tax=Alloprevotella tannerae TaxID=76122 RepID=UPI0028E9AD8D|nr:peptidase [Alloprevotella tannerae]
MSGGNDGLRNGRWKFDRCTVYAKGGGTSDDGYRGSITLLRNKPEFIDCDIIDPIGTYWETSNGSYYLFGANGKVVTDWVKIEPVTKYDLNICGTRVNSANCKDLSVIEGVEGTVKYDHSTKTPTLDNATIKTSDKAAISIKQAMNIKVVGKCKVDAGDFTTIVSTEPFRIFSERNELDDQCLDVVSGDCAIFMNHTDLIIENCTVNTMGTGNFGSGGVGIAGNYSEDKSTLTIKGDYTRVTAEGKGGSICSIVKLTLNGCAVTQPKGAAFDASLQGVALNGELVKSKVVIEKTPSAIEHVKTDALAAKDGIFTLSGVKLNSEVKDLPKGIYIVNGKKFVKK